MTLEIWPRGRPKMITSTPIDNSAQPPRAQPPVLDFVVHQHAEEAAMLRHQRTRLVRAPYAGLLQLARLDERIEAHLDGLLVAGAAGQAAALRCLDEDPTGAAFVLGVLALRTCDDTLLERLLTLGDTLPPARRGLASALGWVPATALQGVVSRMLAAESAGTRSLAFGACRMHRVDPGAALLTALGDRDAPLRSSALCAVGALGRVDLLGAVQAAMADEAEPEVVFSAASAACRLGERRWSLRVLQATALQPGARSLPALVMLMAACTPEQAQEQARHFSALARTQATTAAQRRQVQALGLLGDARHVPWLIDRMREPALARLAGLAFSWISGADLAAQQLESLTPPSSSGDALEDMANDDVALDADEGLPWPDLGRVEAWWAAHAAGLSVAGRLFNGRLVDEPALAHTLAAGTQQQRGHAALLRALRQPAQPLFVTAAPAWRQQRWLAS